jgi:hypothetical protein
MYISKLKNLSRNKINRLLNDLKYKLENQQNLYYYQDIDTIVLSDPKFTFKYKCNTTSLIIRDKFIFEMSSYEGDPVEIYNKIRENTNYFTSILYELQSLLMKKANDF